MTLLLSFFYSASAGVFITLSCIYLLKPMALHIGLVDTPGGRKMHAHAVPLIGGIAIFIGFLFSLLCFNISLHNYRGLLAGSIILVLLGVLDDFKELTPRIRLIGQALAGLILIHWGHLSFDHLGNLFFLGNVNLGIWSWVLTLFFVMGFINAINMIDGHDGLAGLIVLGQAVFLAYLNFHIQQNFDAYLILLFATVLCPFLAFNLPLPWRKRASIFMGDAGSTFIGFVIAWFAISLSQTIFSQGPINVGFNPLTVLWVLAYPLFDLIAVVFVRVRQGKSPLQGGRDHLHHLLLIMGFQRSIVTLLLFTFSLSLGLIGILLAHQKISEPYQLLIFVMLLVVYFIATFKFQEKLSLKE